MSLGESVRTRISQILKQPIEKIADEAVLTELVTDSFLLVEMAIELQEDFNVRLHQEDLNTVETSGDLIRLIASRAAEE